MSMTDGNREISDSDIVQQFQDADEPFVGASELAEQLGMSRQAMNYRLRQLLDDGVVDRKKVGSGYGWWLERDLETA